MDVNDITKVATPANPVGTNVSNQQANIKNLSSSAVVVPAVIEPDSVELNKYAELDAKLRNSNKIEIAKDLNDVISVINQTSDSISKVDQLVSSINGLVEQVVRPDFPKDRIGILQREANELVGEIKKIATTTAPLGIESTEADDIRQKIEKNLGKTLEAILPSEDKVGSSIANIDFSTKENILSVRTNIELAKAQVNELKDRINQDKIEIGETIARNEIAESNREASETSLRDLDQALSLAGKAKNFISANPETALASFNSSKNSYTDLLS